MIRLVDVPAHMVDAIWPRVDAVYEKACSHSGGLLTKDAVRIRSINGSATLWITADDADTEVTATCMTSAIPTERGRGLLVEVMGGKIKYDIMDFHPTLEKRAHEFGCSSVIFLVPWRWKLSRLQGYKPTRLLMIKELN